MARTDTSSWQGVTQAELGQAARNHAMHLEGLRYDVTPPGMHYLVIHFDIPDADDATWTVDVDGLVDRPLTLSMDDLRGRSAVTLPVTMECAGNGRALMPPRAESQPWLDGGVGNAEWTGTSLPGILEDAGLRPEAVELIFTGADHGIQGDVEQDYRWSFSIDDIVRGDVLLAYEMNGQPLPPQHGYPVRLVVPDWYGMCSVKGLTRITAVDEPFAGFQLSSKQRSMSSSVLKKCGLMRSPSPRKSVQTSRARSWWQTFSASSPTFTLTTPPRASRSRGVRTSNPASSARPIT